MYDLSLRWQITYFLQHKNTYIYPKYTLKPIISREKALKEQQSEAIEKLFQGSIINICHASLIEI